jgi:hypothetical protein
VFAATKVTPHHLVDAWLTALNLAKVQLLVVLRDGMNGPVRTPRIESDDARTGESVVDFVQNGGAFLNLHNSMGVYPENGPYLKLVGGRYIGPVRWSGFELRWRTRSIRSRRASLRFRRRERTRRLTSEAKVHLLLRNRSDDGRPRRPGGP